MSLRSKNKIIEPDSELLELYNKQNRNYNPNSNNYDTKVANDDFLMNQQIYTLVDDDDDLTENDKQNNNNNNSNTHFNNNSNLSFNNNEAKNSSRRPIGKNGNSNASPDLKLPVIESHNRMDLRSESINSQDYGDNTKKIIKWNFWWDKPESNIRVPFSYIPEWKKKVNAKVGSLDYVTHKPGGGNIQVVNEKPIWNKEAKVDHVKKDYIKKGGDIKVLDQKMNWNTNSKVGSLANVSYKPGGGNIQILQQPFQKKGIRPRIDTGFMYEEVLVSNDYQVKPTVRNQGPPSPRSTRSPYSVRTHQYR